MKFCIAFVVDDVPEEVKTRTERQNYMVEVLINGIDEEPEDMREVR